MQLPEELICVILANLYYRNPPFSTPDYSTLSACCLVNSLWTIPAQTLLFRRITVNVAHSFGRFVARPIGNQALLSHVRMLAIALSDNPPPPLSQSSDPNDERSTLCPVSTLVTILKSCPKLYELSISARSLFSLGSESTSALADVVRTTSLSIRSLRMVECSVQSPILYEFLALFPGVQFLTLGVEIAASPPSWAPVIRLYELTLHRTLSSEVLIWLVSASETTLRILELRDLPGVHTRVGPRDSLRLMRYNAYTAAILRQCTNLLELVLLNVPGFVSLPELPPTLEHIAVLIQTYTASVDLQPVIAAVDSLPRLRILTFIGDSQLQQIPRLKEACQSKDVAMWTTQHKFWIRRVFLDDANLHTHTSSEFSMLSSALRAGRRISPRCLRHFSVSAPSSSEPALLLGAPEGHRPETSYGPGTAVAIGSGSNTPEDKTTQSDQPGYRPDHGLYDFFRRKPNPNLRGDDQYETFADPTIPETGRAWLASELRLKSFKDLHTLWYVLVRERNLLATQREEMRRMGIVKDDMMPRRADAARCRKSMARIKAIMNERRLAYEGALSLAEKEREEATNAAVLKFKVNAETTEKHRQRAEQIRQKLVKPRSRRAGAKVQARRNPEAAPEGEKKPRWTKEQKLANAQHKQRQREARARPSQRLLHVA
ncbi:mitochondrial 39-S ribosomal protein L47 (MRP-L47)-domain-containing protein [Mycena latifolia]|nr:mitochondrial 39-S ribosomal protein L47 (MRP-L47)-domain-containing protein [Mycena latifolia]